MAKNKTKATPNNTNSETINISRIKLDDIESKRHAIFLNEERANFIRTRLDGGLIKNQPNQKTADWLLSKIDTGDVIVELKGKDVDEATVQILAAAKYLKDTNHPHQGRMAGLILCTGVPRIMTKIQRAKTQFAKLYKGPLHIRSRSGEFTFEYVLSFNGPDKP